MILLRSPRTQWVCESCLTRLRVSKAAKRSFSASSNRHRSHSKPTELLPAEPARTRFAPSPTGYLHLGSLRTALYNYLLAKKTNGQFLLRIEDTDQKRTVADAEKRLFDDLRWAGLEWDEGPEVGGPYGPYKQSERTPLYQQHAHDLLESGHAYRCFCTQQRLLELAEQRAKLGQAPDYDRRCASIPKEESHDRAHKGESHTIRLRAPDNWPIVKDIIHGTVGRAQLGLAAQTKRGQDAYEDPILMKTDGLPTYHLANVVDDYHMRITHVIRGSEWLPSTPKHVALYEAFGWAPPAFAHVGLLVDENGNKLSKREKSTGVDFYKDEGILPETLTNFLALLGWSHRQKSDVMDLQQLIDNFQMKFTKGVSKVTFPKLYYLQKHHAAQRLAKGGKAWSELVDEAVAHVKATMPPLEGTALLGFRTVPQYVESILRADLKNFSTTKSLIERNEHFFHQNYEAPQLYPKLDEDFLHLDLYEFGNAWTWFPLPPPLEGDPVRIKGDVESAVDYLYMAECGGLLDLDERDRPGWDEQAVKKKIQKNLNVFLRWAVAGGKPGPDMLTTMCILGDYPTMKRLHDAFDRIKTEYKRLLPDPDSSEDRKGYHVVEGKLVKREQ